MFLQSLDFPTILDSSHYDLTKDFFEPALSQSVEYNRAVGYFSSGWLRLNAKGMLAFAINGGVARWVTSPILSATDFESLKLGSEAKTDELLYRALLRNVHDLQRTLEKDTLSALAWMVADGVLSFKLALPYNKLSGDFHDKFGVFQDKNGDRLAFIGSYNESIRGTINSESFSIFPSWKHDVLLPYLDSIENRFTQLWLDNDPNVRVFDLPEAIREQILRLRSAERPYPPPNRLQQIREEADPYQVFEPHIPSQITLRDYQEEAINAWFENDCQGLFEMATGTGKTLTALGAAVRLFDCERRLALIVAVPYQHLVDQWRDEMVLFGFRPILAYQSKKKWHNELNREVLTYNNRYRDQLCVITTHRTFSSESFQATIAGLSFPALIIADEAHHLGAERSRTHYPEQIPYRLALSATPDRWFDDEGTKALRGYFGRTVYEYTLERAIGNALTPYYYHPHLVELTEDELDKYHQLSLKISRIYNSDDSDLQETYTALLMKRARLLNDAENKIQMLSQLLDQQKRWRNTLFYCSPNQIDNVVRLAGYDKGLLVHRFTAQEPNRERQQLLRRFADGELHGLVAMKCLDEGVDVPNTKIAFFLASSGNPREFIQRRGRILRKAEGKEFATIHDLIAVPPVSTRQSETYNTERSIIRRELTRFSEFANVARNKHDALNVIWELAEHYQLRDFG